MDFNTFFRDQLNSLRHEGRYRIFAELERQAGSFPARAITLMANAPAR